MSGSINVIEVGFNNLTDFLERLSKIENLEDMKDDIVEYRSMLMYGATLINSMSSVDSKSDREALMLEFRAAFVQIVDTLNNRKKVRENSLPLINGPKGEA
jgi:hypothetical protein